MPGINFAYEYNAYGQLAAETDPMQNRTVYAYHPEAAPGGSASSESGRALDPQTGGYLKQAASAMSSRQFDQYDAAGNLSLFSDSSGNNANYSLDTFNQVQTENITAAGSLSPMSLSVAHGYDNNSNETSKSENWGAISNSFISTYDTRNNLKTFSQTGLGTTSYNYDLNDNVTAIDDASGRSTTFAYNDRNLISGLTSGAGAGAGTSQFDYDGNGSLTQITDARGQATIMAYDGFDRVKSVLDPLGNETLISRANFGNLLTIKRLNSSGTLLRQSTTVNDPLGRMASRSDKLLETSEDVAYVYGYANLPDGGQEIAITDPLGRVSKVSKDKEGKVFKEEDASGNMVDYFYEDGRGNMTRKVENEKTGADTFAAYTTQYVYNDFNKVEKLTENVGTAQEAITMFFYDERGNLSGSIDAEGHKLYHEYDQFGRKVKTTKELASGERIETQFAYDAGNNLVSITDANNNQTRYEYDIVSKRNWLTKVIYPDNTFIEYTYDLNGNVLTEKQRNGTVVANTYNDLNLLTSRAIQPVAGVLDTTGETYEYDGASRLTRATDNDSTVFFAYDSLNRRTSENQNGKLINYTFDKVNNLTSIQYPNQRIIEREFDVLNRIAKVKQGGTDITNMEFIGRTYRMLSKGYQNGDVIKYLYDAGRRNTSIEAKNLNQQIINQYAYGYNKVNLKNYEQRLHDASKGDVYAYDAINRIKNVKFDAPDPTDPLTAQFAKAKTYNLDKVDNILKIVENKNNVDAEILTEMTGANAQLNQYTKFDQWNLAYDANGNTTQKGTQQFSYNFRNQLVKATEDSRTTTFGYDAFGRRFFKEHFNGSTSQRFNYVYSGHQVIEERDGANVIKSRYAYGNGIDEPVEIEKENAGTMKSYLPMQDTNGNVIGLADNTGKLIEKVNYTSYGAPTFIYDHVAPQVDQVRIVSGKINIRFSEAVDQTSAKSAIKIKQGTNDLSGTITFAEDDKLAVFAPSSTLPNALLTITIATDLEDKNGNKLAAEFSQGFTYAGSDLMVYDRVAPDVEKITLLSGKIYVAFSEELDPASIANAIGLTYATGTIAGTSTLENAKTILFTPSSSLFNSTEYTIIVKSTVKDLSGKSLVQFSEKFIYSSSDLLIYQKPDPSEHQESSIGNNTLFQGREFDTETGLYYFRARYLHPQLGSFLQGDPKGYVDSMNPYQSFCNNPVNFTDPMGKQVWDAEAELQSEEILRKHLIKRYGQKQGEAEYFSMIQQINYYGLVGPLIAADFIYNKVLDAADTGYRTYINPIASGLGIEDLVAEEGEFKEAIDFGLKVFPAIKAGTSFHGLKYQIEGTLSKFSGKLQPLIKFNEALGESGHIGAKRIKSVLFGQNMDDRVIPVAKNIGANWLKLKPGEAWGWPKNLNFINRNVNKVMKGTGKIFDIGWQRGRYRGEKAIYIREFKELSKKLKRVFTGKWVTGEKGNKFRLYEWVKK